MAFDFPNAPTEGQEFTPAGGPTYVFNSPSWKAKSTQSLYVAKAGDVMSGDLTITKSNAYLNLNTPAQDDNAFVYFKRNGLIRWQMGKTNNAESSGDTGSIFALSAYNDAGAYKVDVLRAHRDTGKILLPYGLLQFPATANPSSDANTLDDYREGTWVPTITFGGGSTGLTYSSQQGFYTKIGRQVLCTFDVRLSAKGTSTGNAVIQGWPFAPTGPQSQSSTFYYWNMTGIVGQITANTGGLLHSSATTVVPLTDANFTLNTGLVATLTYPTTS